MKKIINLEGQSPYAFLNKLNANDFIELRRTGTEEEAFFYTRLEELIVRTQQKKAIEQGVF